MTTSEKEAEALRRRLTEQAAEATANELILKRAQKRELTLLDADSLVDLFERLTTGLGDSFGIAACTVVLCDPQHELRHLMASAVGQTVPLDVILVDRLLQISNLYAHLEKPSLGPMTAAHRALFPRGHDISSVAILPLARDMRLMGSINIGSGDPQRFTSLHATDIMAHLGSIASFAIENAVNRTRLRLNGVTDALTGWHNRRYLDVRLTEEMARAQRGSATIACLMIDIDHFKMVNDKLGHLAGDEVLKEVSRRIVTQVRNSDVAARFGGEEFVVLLPETDERLARNLAERIRLVVRSTPILVDSDQALTMTVSIGVAAVRPRRHDRLGISGRALIEAADAALYRAKSAGRDKVLSAGSVPIANEIN